jgi:hypothetical protein
LDAPVFVGNGGTLAGSGTTGLLTIATGGSLAIGTSPGRIAAARLDLAFGAALAFDIAGTSAGTGYDQLQLAGGVMLSGNVTLGLTLGFNPADNEDVFTLILNGAGPIAGGRFVHLGDVLDNNERFTVTTGGFSQEFEIRYDGGDGNDLELLAVPEPAAGALLLGGLAIAALRRRRAA